MRNNLNIFGRLLFIALFFVCTTIAMAAGPSTMGYDGYLADSSGNPQAGTATVTVRIYDAQTGGNLLFEEIHPGIVITDGFFNITIGAVGDVNGSTTASQFSELIFDVDYFLTTEIGAPFNTGEMTISGGLRSPLSLLPYAYTARSFTARTSAPVGTSNIGEAYYDSVNEIVYVYNGTSWISLNGLNSVDSNAIIDDSIVDADINSVAAISYSKLNLANSITAGDIFDGTISLADLGGDSVDSSKILDDSIVDADINSVAAIAYSKLNLTGSIVTGDILDGTISLADIGSDAVDSTKIVDGSIDTADINDLAITAAKINDLAVTTSKLALDAVTTTQLLDGTVATADLADLAITSAKINDLAVTTAKLADDAITSAKIVDGTIATADVDDLAVTTAKINDLAITTAKLASDAVTAAQILDGSVGSSEIASLAVITAKINDLAVTTAKLADDAVTSAKILDGTITNADISGTAGVAYSKLNLVNSIVSGDILDGTLSLGDLASDSVNSSKIVDSSITGSDIASNTINGTKIALGSDALGDMMYYDGTDWVRLPSGTNGQILSTDGTSPVWVTSAASVGLGTSSGNTLRWNGSGWVESSALTNNGTNIATTGSFTQSGATSFTTGTGTVSLNGNTSIATGRTLTLTDITSSMLKTNGSGVIVAAVPGTDYLTGTLASAKILVGNGSAVATPVALTGDASLSNAGIITLATGSVTSTKILDGTIALGDLAADSVNSSKIVDGSIATADINDLAITSAKINDLAITTAKLADDAVTSLKILDGAIATSDLDDLVITTAKINDLAVTTAKLADDAITTSKILDGTITSSDIADLLITTAKLNDLAVTTAKLAADAVTSAKILDGTIATADFDDLAVTTAKLNDLAVTTAKLAADAVTSAKILDATITGADIALNTIDGTNIALGSDAAGDIMYYNGTDWTRLGVGTAGQLLQVNTGATAPEWITYDPVLPLLDNITNAYDLQEGTNNYINIDTTNSSENISFGNATTNPSFSFLGSGLLSSANTFLRSQGELRLGDSDSSNYIGFKSPTTVSSNVIWTLPSADGTSGQVLRTNGSGTLSWVTPASGVAGSIQFSTGSGLSSDNSNFYWDDTLKGLGIGTTQVIAGVRLAVSGGGAQILDSGNNPSIKLGDSISDYGYFQWSSSDNSLILGVDTNGPVIELTHDKRVFINKLVNGTDRLQVKTTIGDGSVLQLQRHENSGSGLGMVTFRRNDDTELGYITCDASLLTCGLFNASDIRVKENVNSTTRGLADLMRIGIKDYHIIGNQTNSLQQGVIAQELYEIYPEAVNKGDDSSQLTANGKMWGVDYGRITPLLIKSIQEQQLLLNNNVLELTKNSSEVDAIKGESSRNAYDYIVGIVNNSREVISDFVTARITAINGYFDSIFARSISSSEILVNELCVGTSDSKTCLSKDNIDTILHNSNTTTIISQPSGSGGGEAVTETPASDNSDEVVISNDIVEDQAPQEDISEGAVDENSTSPDAVQEEPALEEAPIEPVAEPVVDDVPLTPPVDEVTPE